MPRRIVFSVLLCLGIATPAIEAIRADEGTQVPEGSNAGRSPPLQTSVQGLGDWVEAAGGRLTAAIVDMEAKATLASYDDEIALNPASTMKIVTAAAVLDALGPAFTFQTGVYGAPGLGAARALTLRGHGDPSLREADLWRLARSLARRGLERVETLHVDQSRFDAAYVPPAFDQQPNEWASFRAPVSAIALEQNSVVLNVVPTEPGRAATAWFEPEGFVTQNGAVQTVAPGKGQGVHLTLVPGSGRLEARLGGHIASGLGRAQYRRRVDDPRLFAGFVLARLLERQGVTVGTVAAGGRDEKLRLTYVESEPLAVLVRQLGKQSDNFYAEMLLKVLGAEARGAPGTSENGAQALRDFLRRIDAIDSSTRIVNGSGLFDANRLSARTLVRVLAYAYQSPSLGSDFVAQLAVGGVDGTLRSRFRNHRDDRAVRAKTGTLDKVIALGGYVLPPGGGGAAAFAFIVEGASAPHHEIRERIDRVVEELWRSRR